MKCYACEKTTRTSRYRLGREGLCEFESLDACKQALENWRKKQRPPRPRFPFFLLFVYLLLS